MAPIDDPLEATSNQYPAETGNPTFDLALEVAASVVPPLGVASALRRHFSEKGRRERFEALFQAIGNEIRGNRKEIKDVREHLDSPEFINTLIIAINKTIETSNRTKIQRFASVLSKGITSDEDRINWDEISEFIRDLSELGEADIETLSVLCTAQKRLFTQGPMTTDPNAYTYLHKNVLQKVDQQGIPHEEFYSRCARLNSYGLVFEVQRNPTRMKPGEHCFRVTSRGRKLFEMLEAIDGSPSQTQSLKENSQE